MDTGSEQSRRLNSLQNEGRLLSGGSDRSSPVLRVETHISVVLIGPDLVFKYKKLVDFPFITQGTPEMQLQHCRAEVELNRDLAPDVYVGVFDLVYEQGKLALIEWKGGRAECPGVLMHRLPEERSLRALVQKPDFQNEARELIPLLAEKLAIFHHRRNRQKITASQFIKNYNDNLPLLAGSPAVSPDLLKKLSGLLEHYQPSILRRSRAGHVVQGHGDLRLDHVYFLEGRPTVIDCIEFNPDLSLVDPYEDLAFLTLGMRMEHQHEMARLLAVSYASCALDAGGYNLLPLFEIYRACVRIKIDIIQSQTADALRQAELSDRITRYVQLIERLLADEKQTGDRRIHVFYGLPATGKSTRALQSSHREGLPVVSTDRLRKKMIGLDARERASTANYSAAWSARVYRRQAALARQFLVQGGVVLDGVFGRRGERQRIERLARKTGASLTWNRCEATPAQIKERLALRREKPGVSDLTDFDTWLAIQSQFEE